MNKDFLKELLITAKAMDAPPRPPSQRAKERFDAAFAEKFGQVRVLPLNALRVVILKLLNNGTLTGSEIIEKLAEHRIETEPKGDGVVLGLLHQMESDGMIAILFQESTATRRYEIANPGSQLLRREEGSVLDQYGLAALLNAQ